MTSGNLSRKDEENQSHENSQHELVLYDPSVNDGGKTVISSDPTASLAKEHPSSNRKRRVSPPVQSFAVQCASCFKWRLIPTKEKYEEIRETIIELPFSCETGREWRPEITCDDPPDVVQDGSRIWAIDKPSIARTPPGWQRFVRIRGQGGARFADVHYVAPTGKRLRSMVEVQRFLNENIQYIEEGVSLSKFSFKSPKPLQENYVRKPPAHAAPTNDNGDHGVSESFEHPKVQPIPTVSSNVDKGEYSESRPLKPQIQPSKKKRTASKRRCNANLVHNQNEVNVDESSALI